MRSTRPLTVLVVAPFGVLGGAESWLLSVLDGWQPGTPPLRMAAVLLTDGPLRAELERRGVEVTVRHTGSSGLAVLGAIRWLRSELRRHDPDVVLANGVKAAAVACPAAATTGVPSVWVKHDHSFDGRLTAWLGMLATSVIATVSDVGTGAARDDVVVLEPPRPAGPLPAPQALHGLAQAGALASPKVAGHDDIRLLVMLGRLVPYKGIDTAIRALALPGGKDWQLAALGGNEPARPRERQRLLELAAELGVVDRVRIPGHVPAAAGLLAAADAVAMLTRPDGPRTPGREGFGMTAMEAMVAGVPVIAIDDGGPVARRVSGSDDPFGGPAGLLVDGSPEGMAGALEQLHDRAYAAELGTTGRLRARNHPDAEQLRRRCIDVLCLAARRPGAGATDGPPISIVTPVLNEIEVLDRLIPPIATAMGPDDEYLLVDSGSTDGTRDALEAWSASDDRIRLIRTDGGTIARSRNAGIQTARHDFVACTDAGCAPDETWIAGLRAAAAHTRRALADPGPGRPEPPVLYVGVYRVAVRPRRLFEQAMAAVSWPDPAELRRPTLGRRLYGRLLGRRFDTHRVDGRSVGFTKAAWQAAGGFPEQLPTAEDEAFGRAVLATGARAALTLDAAVTWFQRGSIGATFRQFRGYGHGGGTSRSVRLLVRDGVRVVAYAAAIVVIAIGGWWGVALVTVAGLAYLWLPLTRLHRRGHWSAAPLVPLCAIGKDVAKVLGTAEALLRTFVSGVMTRGGRR